MIHDIETTQISIKIPLVKWCISVVVQLPEAMTKLDIRQFEPENLLDASLSADHDRENVNVDLVVLHHDMASAESITNSWRSTSEMATVISVLCSVSIKLYGCNSKPQIPIPWLNT